MSQNTRESLSALMDSESDELELRRVLKALPDDADAADRWRRYHLARSMMQREQGVDVSVDLSAGIMARLQDEPAPMSIDGDSEKVASPRTNHVSFARGAGVAAAVSLMVITGVQFFGNSSSTGQSSGDMTIASTGGNASAGQVQPVNLAQPASMTSAGMPMFEPTPFRLNGQSQSGLMNVSEAGLSSAAMPQSAVQSATMQQGNAIDVDQIRLLQSYLEQHSQGAAYGNGDSWMPLMRSSSITEPLGQR